ncbi:DUF945 domain-containing protein [Aliidiomarina halalkaliphila]|uniref:DUF945 domain-containing protein n=1 Tax=Aliidiomarina halalkaliphila TaxID=2593535 RepID=A0A552X151_9GAMM|nr:DUF945 family protein [Aliidiomarina halalkaliphila]TRW48778.1 DUF945 domain-containing protein [Aliidiomarina halalkaliphila]
MKKGIIAIVVAVVLIGGYVFAQTATRNATVDIIEQYVDRLEAESGHAYDVELNWLEQGWRTGKVEMTLRMDFMEEEILYHEVFQLTYGFLRTQIRGIGQLTVFEDNVNETIFDGKPFVSKGVASMGGLTLEYTVPNIDRNTDGMVLNIPETIMQVVATDTSLHYTLHNPGFRLYHESDPGHFSLGEVSVESHTAWRLEKLQHSHLEMKLASLDMDTPDLNFSMSDFLLATHLMVEDGIASGSVRYEVGQFDVPEVGSGNALLEMEVQGVNYALFEHLQQNPDLIEDEAFVAEFFYDLVHNNDARLLLNTFEFEAEGIGRAHVHGSFGINDTQLDQDEFMAMIQEDASALIPYMAVSLTVEELPLIALMSMMMITTEQLPWLIEMRDGEFYLNGEILDLENMGLPE